MRSVYAAPQHYNNVVQRRALGQWRRASVDSPPSPVLHAALALLEPGLRASFGQWRVLTAVFQAGAQSINGACLFKQSADLVQFWVYWKIAVSGSGVADRAEDAAETHFNQALLTKAISGWHIVSIEKVAQSFLDRRAVRGYTKLLLLQGLIRWVNWLCASVSGEALHTAPRDSQQGVQLLTRLLQV